MNVDTATASLKSNDSDAHVAIDKRQTYDLKQFSLSEIVRCGSAVRKMHEQAHSMEEVANILVRHLFENCVDPQTNEQDIALVRFFKTHPFGLLDAGLQAAAQNLCPSTELKSDTKCLVLLATAGMSPAWNTRHKSEGHQAIPLVSKESVSQIPMIAQLIQQFGLELESVISTPSELMVELDERSYNVFHVENALGSPFIPAQESFVEPFGVKSVVGFGGMLPTGNLFTSILFSKAPISRLTGEAFQTIALSVKSAILPFEQDAVFDESADGQGETIGERNQRLDEAGLLAFHRSKAAALEELGRVYDSLVIDQSSQLEQTVVQLDQKTDSLQKAQAELIHAEKLASVGQLASGIAHEINTPIQFVGDNVRACSNMFDDLKRVFDEYQPLLDSLNQDERYAESVAKIREAEQEADVEYIFEDAPQAFSQALEGVEHVRKIVQAMKNFSHSGRTSEKSLFDLNAAIENVLIVAANELRCVAKIETDFGDLPEIEGSTSELNQVFLNVLINAAHAVQDKGSKRGTIKIRTQFEDGEAHVEIRDTGCGMPEAVRQKIFDPFFTTKDVGRGSGQGLTIAYNIIVDGHAGKLECESQEGVGTTFHIRIPVHA